MGSRRGPLVPAGRVRSTRHALGALALAVLAGCGPGGASAPATTPVAPTPTVGAGVTAAPSTAAGVADPDPSAPPPAPPGTAASTAPRDCAAAALLAMTPSQRAGQLLMVGLSSGSPGAAAAVIAVRDVQVGGIVLDGTGWNGAARIHAAVDPLQALTGGRPARLLVAGNQEGGEQGSLQAFYGPGFDRIPTALEQGGEAPQALQGEATRWGAQLAAAGVNLDLAPVADTVPPGTDAENAPIGALRRAYGHDPAVVGAHAAAVVRGLRAGGVQATLKHFPGLGRVRANTDFDAAGTVDTQTGSGDAALRPFAEGVGAGAGFVMVSSATYPRIDPANRAVFSPPAMALLRQTLGDQVVVVSDDVGAAASVSGVPVGDRALRFVAAGGDIVLTVEAGQAPTMSAALVAQAGRDAGFARLVDAASLRVLRAKAAMGLLPGC